MTHPDVTQALMFALNCFNTGRRNMAVEVVAQAVKVEHTELADHVMWHVVGQPASPELKDFSGEWWRGEYLDGKTVEVFCDQGMGDAVQCLRYLNVLKGAGCKVVLNYYAFHDEFHRLAEAFGYETVKTHVRCDYYTNVLSVPHILEDGVTVYPPDWRRLLSLGVPEQPGAEVPEFKMFNGEAFRVGVAAGTNAANPLAEKKSVPLGCLLRLEDGVNELWSVNPSDKKCNFMVKPRLADLLDTASLMRGLDVVVTADTVALHLAGTLGVRTLAMLSHDHDPRWGSGDRTAWYPTVELFRRPATGGWEPVVEAVRRRILELRSA